MTIDPEKLAAIDRQFLIDEEYRRMSNPAYQLVSKGWEYAYAELFGQDFVDVMAPHHREAVEWHWNSRLAFLTKQRPEYLAYFPIWSRGHMKSTLAERIVVMDAVLSVAYGQPGFTLYIGREKERVREHISNIEVLMTSEGVRKYCPTLSEVAKNEETNQKKQWTGTFLHTKAGYVVKGGSIESSQAGSRVDQTRPTFIVPDDIDSRDESIVISETKFRRLTREILPMRQDNTLVYFAQNLISRYSTMYRIQSGKEKALVNRKPAKPIPAVIDLKTEERVVDGIVRDVYVSGTPTWKFWDVQRIQDEIDSYGLAAFLIECQHEVGESNEGRVHKKYDDNVHAISKSQFAAVYGEDAWKDWYKVVFNDWSRTKTRFHANVAGYFAVSSANTKHPGFTFCIPMSFKADTTPEDVAIRLLTELQPHAYRNGHDVVTWQELADQCWKRLNAEQHFETLSDRLKFAKNYYGNVIPKYSKPILQAYKVRAGVNSHSEDKVREMFNAGFGFGFEPSNPGKTDALEDIDEAMKVDYDEPHLFKPDVKGYTRWYLLCEDDLSQEPIEIDGYFVYPPKPFPNEITPDNLHDDDLFRWQLRERRFKAPKLTEGGELVDEMLKMDDDVGQAFQMVYLKKLLQNIKLSKEELFEGTLAAKGLSHDQIQQTESERDQIALIQAQMEERRAFAKKNKKVSYPRVGGVVNPFRK